MSELFNKIEFFCQAYKKNSKKLLNFKIGSISNYYPQGIKVNIIVLDNKIENYTLLISDTSCKVVKGFSSSQLNLSALPDVWDKIFSGKYRVIKGIMEGKIKVRGIRSMVSPLIILSSLFYLYSEDFDNND
ncbi:MAG: hypothetical protein ACTSWR_00365 [Candidatus Helarchaeota archaeon]